MTALHWLESPSRQGVTWGVPWPRGTVAEGTYFALADGTPLQSWISATWPDGSVKWSAHAIGPAEHPASSYDLVPGQAPDVPDEPVVVTEFGGEVQVRTGEVTWVLREPQLIASIRHGDREVAQNVRLVSLRQETPDEDNSRDRQETIAEVERIVVEQDGPVRAVVRVEGRHRNWLPFTVRLYFCSRRHRRTDRAQLHLGRRSRP